MTIMAFCLSCCGKMKKKITRNGITFESNTPQSFPYKQLARATHNFKEERKLGEGAFGAVYRGVLPDGRHVAIKRVQKVSEQGIKGYKAEVTILSRANHSHLVPLIGWCHDKEGQLLLVYELMENRSLDFHLFDQNLPPLPWDVRHKIALGLAKALRYLHEDSTLCVLHRDIKSSNVMLDLNFDCKLGDFGLAKVVDHDEALQMMSMVGTLGYIAPEYVVTGEASRQSDIYSYGVVVLEIATGKRCINEQHPKCLLEWVRSLWKDDRIMEAVDSRLGDEYHEQHMKELLTLGLWCAHRDAHKRPQRIDEVVSALEYTEDSSSNHSSPTSTIIPLELVVARN